MEVSVIGKSQAKMGRARFSFGERRLSILKANSSGDFASKAKICFGQGQRCEKVAIRCTLNAVQTDAIRSGSVSGLCRASKSHDSLRLFVGLPLDSVSVENTLNHAKAVAAGLKALKLLGVEGVELPVWWGIAEKEAMGQYEFSSYLALVEMVQNAGLKLHVSLCFHASKQQRILLPNWVSEIGKSQPGIYFTDKSGNQYKDCLSLAVDDLPVLNGKTPTQVYHEFCDNLKSSFSSFMGSTITDITMGLGPDGELKYPSQQQLIKGSMVPGVGEFQCYDPYILNLLKHHAEASGNPCWGLGGPHDVPSYTDSPNSNRFFKDHGGSWESPYGDFFLSWYSNKLIAHGDRLLALASSVFNDDTVTTSGKLPLIHSWYKTRSHPSELTTGFFNTATRDGYEAVAEMFAKNSCKMILPGMDLSDEHQSQESLSSPESLLAQIRTSCRKHGVKISGQNSSDSGVPGGFAQIKKNCSGKNVIDMFTYQRMGSYFFSPEHFPSFTEFVRSVHLPELHSDDLSLEEEEDAKVLLPRNLESGLHMQAA